jgi:multidrug efflux system membrane fusion protein
MQKTLPFSGSLTLFAAAGAMLCLTGCGAKKPEAAPKPPPRLVTTAKVIVQDAPLYLDEIGMCVASESVAVQAQVTGQIIQRHFEDGADVKKGDLLFTIDPRPYQAALEQAEGTLAQNRAQLDLDNINLRRVTDLQKKQVVAPQELDTARTSVATDEARIQSAQAAVAAAKVNLDYCSIRAPIDGRTGLRQVDTGNIVNPGSGSAMLVSIQRLDPIYTDFTVSEGDLPQVRQHLAEGKIKVETDLPDDTAGPRQGTLYFIDNAVQQGAGTVKLRGVTPNPDRLLWPGAFARVRLILDTLKEARLIPNQAVQISQRGPFVFVVKPDKTLEQRFVKPGQRQGELLVITEGIQPGETVVTSGQLALAPGAVVNPQPDPTAPKEIPGAGSPLGLR